VGIESLRRGLRAVEILAEHEAIGVSELARQLDVPKSTAQRLLATLAEAGWARRTGGGPTRWRLTRTPIGMRGLTALETQLREAARPALVELGAAACETVHLLVREGNAGMALIDRIECDPTGRTWRSLGTTSPLHATAAGLAVLAHGTEADLRDVLANGLERLTDKTITDPQRLREALRTTFAHGYAISREANRPDVCSIGAPVFDDRHTPIAAVTVTLPDFRFVPDRAAELGVLVRAAADQVTAALTP
jgi:IclR family transcriptional regulator, acetate operon repressor